LTDGSGKYIRAIDAKTAAEKAATAIAIHKNNKTNRGFIVAFKETTKTCKVKRIYRYWASVSNSGKVVVKKWHAMSGGGNEPEEVTVEIVEYKNGNKVVLKTLEGVDRAALIAYSEMAKEILEACKCKIIHFEVAPADVEKMEFILNMVKSKTTTIDPAITITKEHIELAVKYQFKGVMHALLPNFLQDIPNICNIKSDIPVFPVDEYPLELIDQAFLLLTNKHGILALNPISTTGDLDRIRESLDKFISHVIQKDYIWLFQDKWVPDGVPRGKRLKMLEQIFIIPADWFVNISTVYLSNLRIWSAFRETTLTTIIGTFIYFVENARLPPSVITTMTEIKPQMFQVMEMETRNRLCRNAYICKDLAVVVGLLDQFCKLECPHPQPDGCIGCPIWIEKFDEEATDEEDEDDD